MEKPVSTIDKVLDVLLLFSEARHRLSIEEISQLLDMPKSSVYRYVRILCDKGFLEKVGTAHYRLGLTFVALSRAALNSNRDIRLIALPSMKRLAEVVGESVSLMRVFNQQVICIESIEGRQALRVTIEKGRTQPLYAGASSKLLLAFMDETLWAMIWEQPLSAITSTTITQPDRLIAELQEIRERGYAVSDGEIDVGARAIAVPIRDGHGEVIAALSIEGPASRMADDTVMQYLALLRDETARIYQEFS